MLILILAGERRVLRPEPRAVRLVGKIWYWTKRISQSLGAGVSLVSVILAGQAVIGIVVSLVLRGYFGNTEVDPGEERMRQKTEDDRDTRRFRRARKLARRNIDVARGRRATPGWISPAPARDSRFRDERVGKPPIPRSPSPDARPDVRGLFRYRDTVFLT